MLMMKTYLEFVQSSYKMSNSLHEMSLHLLTPGCMAPRPLSTRTCSTLHTTGVISSRFSLVYTVCRPPTKCFKNSSKACGRQINSRPSTLNAAIFAPRQFISLQTLFSGLHAMGGGELQETLCSLLRISLPWLNIALCMEARLWPLDTMVGGVGGSGLPWLRVGEARFWADIIACAWECRCSILARAISIACIENIRGLEPRQLKPGFTQSSFFLKR